MPGPGVSRYLGQAERRRRRQDLPTAGLMVASTPSRRPHPIPIWHRPPWNVLAASQT